MLLDKIKSLSVLCLLYLVRLLLTLISMSLKRMAPDVHADKEYPVLAGIASTGCSNKFPSYNTTPQLACPSSPQPSQSLPGKTDDEPGDKECPVLPLPRRAGNHRKNELYINRKRIYSQSLYLRLSKLQDDENL